MTVAVCWKWVSSDGGSDEPDTRWAGVSHADEAALEIALELEPTYGAVTVACVGPVGADGVLRDALAAGAGRVVRIDAPADTDSRQVAIALAAIVAGSDFVLCGDYSADRGTGSVPAFLAHELGAAQALGLVGVDVTGTAPTDALHVVRRLDGGRREVLAVSAPAVLSVEGSVRRLRRASLAATVRSKSADIELVGSTTASGDPAHHAVALVTPYRPRARTLPAPAGSVLSRVREILDVGASDTTTVEMVELDPAAAAARIVEQLRRWGHLCD
jgi:electron transfer flavoprotein beta subunit